MPITPILAVAARRELQEFFDDTLDFLESLVRDENVSYFIRDLAPLVRNAWGEFMEDINRPEIEQKIRNLPENILVAHGLYGSQLELKLRIIDYAKRKFWEVVDGVAGKKEILKWVIESIDTLLESLLDAVGLAKAIKEIKECLNNALDWIEA